MVIRVLAEQGAVEGESHAAGYLPGFGPMPSTLLRDLAGVAKTKPLSLPRPARRPAIGRRRRWANSSAFGI
ncbi:MAG: hypothetical protein WAO15_17930 [Mycobacterium sp.]